MKFVPRNSNIKPENILSEIKDSFPNGTKYEKILIRFVISNEKPLSKIVFGRIDFLNTSDESPTDKVLDYNTFILTQLTTNFDKFETILEKINNGENFEVNGVGNVLCQLEEQIRWETNEIPSQKSYGYIQSDYPFYYFSSRMSYNGINSTTILAGKDLPPYLDLADAIHSFLDLHVGERNSRHLNESRILITVPDYRAKIEKLKIFKNKLQLNVKVNDLDDIICQFNVDGNTWKEIQINNSVAEISDISEPKEILAIILDKKNNEVLDYKEVNLNWIGNDSSIELEEHEDVIKEWINRGESEFVEFKEVLKHEDDVMKTAISFANTRGGIIILGVNDEGSIVGYEEPIEKTKNRFERMVAQKCDPRVDFEIHRLEEDKLTYIKIKKGTQPVYALTNGPVYVRKGASDVHIKPSELMQRFEKKPANSVFY